MLEQLRLTETNYLGDKTVTCRAHKHTHAWLLVKQTPTVSAHFFFIRITALKGSHALILFLSVCRHTHHHILAELSVSDWILHWRQLGIYKLVSEKWLNRSFHKENMKYMEHLCCSQISFWTQNPKWTLSYFFNACLWSHYAKDAFLRLCGRNKQVNNYFRQLLIKSALIKYFQ